MEGLHATYPLRWRLVALVAAVLVAGAVPLDELSPLAVAVYMAAVALAAAIICQSIFRPDGYLALQQDGRDRGSVDEINKLVDVFYAARVFDDDTNPAEVEITWDGPGRFRLYTEQIGKTERQIRDACEGSLMAFNAVGVDVEKLTANDYLITYRDISDLDRLAGVDITYSGLLERVRADGYY